MLDLWLLIPLTGIAGGLGSVVRAVLSRWKGALAFGVLTGNVLAASIAGWVLGGPGLSADYQVALAVGFAGGLSTFSAVAQSAWDFWHNGRLVQMLLTLITNTLIPLTALLLVLWLL
jgi:fluoride exporter